MLILGCAQFSCILNPIFSSQTQYTHLRLLVNVHQCRAVIGKGGSMKNKILQGQKALRLVMSEAPEAVPERVFNLSGNFSHVMEALLIAQPVLELGRLHGKEVDKETELRMLVQEDFCGSLIGKGGSVVKGMAEKTGAHMKLTCLCLPMSNERIAVVRGAPAAVNALIGEIFKAIMTEGKQKNQLAPYDALNYREEMAEETGGVMPDGYFGNPFKFLGKGGAKRGFDGPGPGRGGFQQGGRGGGHYEERGRSPPIQPVSIFLEDRYNPRARRSPDRGQRRGEASRQAFSCHVCNLEVFGETALADHLASAAHRKRVEGEQERPVASCHVCRLEIFSAKDVMEHFRSREHCDQEYGFR